jgi:hypothetical protein
MKGSGKGEREEGMRKRRPKEGGGSQEKGSVEG